MDEELLRTLLMQQSSQLDTLHQNMDFYNTGKTRPLNLAKSKKQKKSNTQSVDFFAAN
jgi:hypothetical protein